MLLSEIRSNSRCSSLPSVDWQYFDHLGSSCFMSSSSWLRNAWLNYSSFNPSINSDSPYCLKVSDEDHQTCGQSVWFKQFSRGISWWRLVGSGPICSDYVNMPSLPEAACQTAEATAIWFASQPRKFLEVPIAIEVEGHADCPQWQTFFATLVNRQWTQDTVEIESAWRVSLPDDWRSYELLLSKSRRRKVRRALKLVDQGQMSFELTSDPQEISMLWPEFERLHQLRRQQLGQPGIFSDEHFGLFLKSVTIELAERSTAFLASLTYQGELIGMLLLFQSDRTWFVYQSGFDPSKIDLEPGHMINALMLHQAMQNNIQEVDFLRGDEPYKKGWNSNRNQLYRTILLPPGLASRGISSALKLKRNVKNWLKSKPAPSSEAIDNEQ